MALIATTLAPVKQPGALVGWMKNITAQAVVTAAEARGDVVRRNDIVQFILVAALIVLLALGATVVIGAIAMCAANGGVMDAVVSVDPWTFKIYCHKL